ncbi:lupus La protein [Chanos chanos]|uniref:Lupus La protein n=1 Tax=Chanos chanos TaxID=29144 RepID=A0A6J2W0A7_CHACN|nr:lupus La protein [Chanos chanos]
MSAKGHSNEMAENQEVSPLEKKVAEQIEYYFGDHNLPRDKFLKEQLQLDDGWVPLETMLKFNRLKMLTSDCSVIVEALRKSRTGLLEVSEDKTKIRRCPSKPLPEFNEEYRDALKHKSVYMKGFPLETTLDDIKDWLSDKGMVENIHMRKGPQKTFKGSVFLVLETEDAAKAFVAREDVKQFKGNDMIVMMKDDYFTKKFAEKKQSRAEAKAKARSEKEEKQKQAEEEEMKSLDDQRGCLLRFSGNLGDQTSREDFHELFAEHAQIKWIDFTRGAKEGTILFTSSAKEALEKARQAQGGAEPKIKEKEVKWEVLEGDAEMETLKKIIMDQQESLNKRKGKGGHRGKGRGRGGRRDRGGRDQPQFQGKKTKFDSDDEEPASPKKRSLEANGNDTQAPAAKQAKTENGS